MATLSGPTGEELRAVKRRAAERLLAIPGVTAVGLGSKEVGGRPTGRLVIKVFVAEKRPPDEVPEAERIPPEFEGVPTDVVVGGRRIPVDAPPGAIPPRNVIDNRERPLLGGTRITPEGSEYPSTMGCLVRHSTDDTKVYGLTVQHAVSVPDLPAPVVGTSRVGQPTGRSSFTECCDDIVGTYAGGGREYDVRDEALVQLSAGTQWLAEITEIGVVAGTHDITDAEAATGAYAVCKYGARTRLTGGTVSALEAETENGPAKQIVVAPNAHPDPQGRTVFFAYDGDSGAVLVNDDQEVVGLIWSRDNSGNAYAWPIDEVLSRLAAEALPVEVATAASTGVINTVPGAAMVPVAPEVDASLVPVGAADGEGPAAPERAGGGSARAALGRPAPRQAAAGGWLLTVPPPPAAAVAHLQVDLDRTPAGRRLLTFWLEHQEELVRIVDGNRRVATGWHRSGASALFQLVVRMAADPGVRVPVTVNGQPVSAVLDSVHSLLSRAASPRLRADLGRVRAMLPDPAGLSYSQLIGGLDAH